MLPTISEDETAVLTQFDRCALRGLARLRFRNEPEGLYTVEASICPEGRSRWRRVFVAPQTPLADLSFYAMGAMAEALERLGPLEPSQHPERSLQALPLATSATTLSVTG